MFIASHRQGRGDLSASARRKKIASPPKLADYWHNREVRLRGNFPFSRSGQRQFLPFPDRVHFVYAA